MNSPPSEKSEVRPGSPTSDLDDHRFQPTSLPRADASIGAHHHNRRDTARSRADDEVVAFRADALQVSATLHPTTPVSRDFERSYCATEDAGKSPGLLGDEEIKIEQQGSPSPAVGRRATLKQPQNPGKPNRSRASSTSSQSSSAPNSVDAFADPRRRERAGTIGSKISEPDLCLHRTVSNGTAPRRRGTFTEDDVKHAEGLNDAISKHDSAEEDVCFPPPEETSKTYTIDFEALEEFVAEQAEGRSHAHVTDHRQRRTHSLSSGSPPLGGFNDMRLKSCAGNVAHTVTEPNLAPQRSAQAAGDDTASVLNEKLGDDTTANEPVPVEPNRFSFFSSELDATVHAAEMGDLVMPGDSFRDLFELHPDGGVWWLDMLNPTEEEIHVISKAFSIHPLTTEDIKTQEAREKVELFRQYYFVCFRSFHQLDKTSEDYMDPVNVYLVVFREGVLSFTFSQSPHAANVRKRIGRLRDYVALSADWICYAMIDDIVDTFGPVIQEVEHETDVIEDQVFVARADDFSSLLRQIGECRRKVMVLMRLLGGKADVIKGFAKRCNEQYSVTPRGEIGLYLGDIQDHVVTMMSNLAHSEKMLSRSHSNYLAQLSVDSIAQGNRANEVLSKITLIATILVPLNLICGLFGMNVPVPGRNSDGLEWFFGILGVIGCIIATSLLVAKKFRFI
ncbi:MAG: Mg(2+) transporter [Caeruleum heppii]|nr:MAG: Mg(2+) transporter [Caeruleum heppii]